MMKLMRNTILALLLCSAVQVEAQPVERAPSAAQLRDWAAGPCIRAANHAGIDYADALDRAIAEDPRGLATLFRFTDSGWCDGAAAEGHCVILFGLLQRWGDHRFSRALRAQKTPIRKAVFNAVAAFPDFKPTEFPLTNASQPH